MKLARYGVVLSVGLAATEEMKPWPVATGLKRSALEMTPATLDALIPQGFCFEALIGNVIMPFLRISEFRMQLKFSLDCLHTALDKCEPLSSEPHLSVVLCETHLQQGHGF